MRPWSRRTRSRRRRPGSRERRPRHKPSGATGNNKYWKITPGAGKTLRVTISGGSGDVDLYVRPGSRPTTTTYLCRPYLNGNNETCTIPNTAAGDYYIMLRAYTTYAGVTLRGSF